MILRCFAASDARFASYSVQGCKHTVYAAPQKAVLSRASRRLTRSPLYVAAFKESPDNAITFPLDYYRVLTVNRASSPEVVRVAYERQLRSPPDVGYTQDTLFSRAVLLRDAAECLQNYNSRRMYDSMALSSTGYAVDVSPHYLPAALVLLQESGQSGLVIKLGAEWLSRNSGDQTACDVAAAVALAHCEYLVCQQLCDRLCHRGSRLLALVQCTSAACLCVLLLIVWCLYSCMWSSLCHLVS